MSDLDLDQLLGELGISLEDTLRAAEARRPTAPSGPTPGAGAAPATEGQAQPAPAPRAIGAIVEDPSEGSSTMTGMRTGGGPDSTHHGTEDGDQAAAAARMPAAQLASFRLVYDPVADPSFTPRPTFGGLLAERNIVEKKALSGARTVLRQSPGLRLLDVLRDQGADEPAMLAVLAESLGLAFRRVTLPPGRDGKVFAPGPGDPATVAPNSGLIQRLGVEFCQSSFVLPLECEADRAVFATSRPDDVAMIEEMRLRMNARSVCVVVAPSDDIHRALAPFDKQADVADDVNSILSDIEEDDVLVEKSQEDEGNAEEEAAEGPVIRLVNYIIQSALKEGASDIHVEPGETALKIRFRIDGILFEMMQPPHKMAPAITSRLKIMANLDISERRIPQDGRIRCIVMGRKMDLRMSTIPTAWGEKTVLRILDQKSISVSLDDLGFDADILGIWRHQIEQPHGIVLVTGPTGSGKTTTLYASLRAMDKKSRNISTVEDPIEYQLEGITQTGMHEKIGMTFSKALKALLRQDPDIIMLGEIRDLETASTAIQAALTGHLVLSTLHTNDAPSSITRLVNIGVEPFLLGAACNATLAQRLVRRICANCKGPAELNDEQREFFELQGMPTDEIVMGKGCDKCRNLGYSGRVGLYELLTVDDWLRDVIARNPNVTEFRRMCCERGMTTLRQDGYTKVKRGLTTVQEVLRVTESTA